MALDVPSLKGPYQPRKASASLREQLVNYLKDRHIEVGQPFFSDFQLVELSGLSRKSVRRALDQMHREGWIERQPGKGTYVGPRAAMTYSAHHAGSDTDRSILRLAVVSFNLGEASDWYSSQVIAGIDEKAEEEGVSIELLGFHNADVKVLSRRLMQNRPNVLAVMPSTISHAIAVAEALRQDIPCILTGTRLLGLRLPTVYEDGVQGSAMAVKHLVEKGHRRIGFAERRDPAEMVFDRREGYINGLLEAGIEPDERLVHWLPFEAGKDAAKGLWAYLQKHRPTALILGTSWPLRALGTIIREHGLKIPGDLSIVTFDQTFADHQLYLGMRPTVVELPLRRMGQQLAVMARHIVEGKSLQDRTSLSCTLSIGESVAACPA